MPKPNTQFYILTKSWVINHIPRGGKNLYHLDLLRSFNIKGLVTEKTQKLKKISKRPYILSEVWSLLNAWTCDSTVVLNTWFSEWQNDKKPMSVEVSDYFLLIVNALLATSKRPQTFWTGRYMCLVKMSIYFLILNLFD